MKYPAIAQRLHQIIKVEAKDTSEAYFLATHKPFEKLKYVPRNMRREEVDFVHEEQFFRTVFNQMERHHFIMVTGDNGSGKSHLIRWVKEHLKYSGFVDKEKETILFISRAQSTLRGALEQIMNAQVFQQNDMAEKMRKLVQANEHLSKDGLKQRIIHHLAIAVNDDEENGSITSRDRGQLYTFLVDQDTKHFVMGEDGPIERIQKKLSSEARNEVMTDVTPRFEASDFAITIDQLETVKRSDAGRRALRFIESVADSTNALEQQAIVKKRERFAAYLNDFLDRVVQECTQFRGTDLTEIFKLLRQELKLQGKCLTLLIEDITSFTGIDKALIDVLGYTHEGTEYDESLCRLISIVGVTNWYYDNAINDNFKERVTANLYVDDAFCDVSDIVDMTARYLNAIYLEPERVDAWLQSGAQQESLPLSEVFKEHKWAQVEIGSHTMTLFPFSAAALRNFHNKRELKTPRRFLQDVLLKYVHWMLLHGLEMFPPEYSSTGLDVAWTDEADDAVLKREAAPNLVNRYMTLFRIWGNRSLDSYTLAGSKYVGGLSEDVFRSFGLPMLSGNAVAAPSPTKGTDVGTGSGWATIGIGIGTSSGTTGEGGYKPFSGSGSGVGGRTRGGVGNGGGSTTFPPTDPTTEPPMVEDPRESRFRLIELDIEKWMSGETLVSFSQLLLDLIAVLDTAIRWEEEGISATQVKDYLSPRRIEIEGQSGTVITENKLVFHREESLRYALLALAAWRERGTKSWQFSGSEEYTLMLYNWIRQHQQRIIEFVRDPYHTGIQTEVMDEITTVGQLIVATLSESLSGTITSEEELYLQLAKLVLQAKAEQTRDPKWQMLQKKLPKDIRDLSEHYLRYFNLVQGEVRRGATTDVYYLHAARVLPHLKKMLGDTWSFDQVVLPEKPKTKSELSWYRFVNLLHDINLKLLPEVILAEYAKADHFANHVTGLLGGDIREVSLLFDEMKQMLKWLTDQRESFDPVPFQWMLSNKCNPDSIIPFLQQLSSFSERKGEASRFIVLSQDPTLPLCPYHDALVNFHGLIDRLHVTYQQRLTNAGNASDDAAVVNETTKGTLQTLFDELQLMNREVPYVTR